MTTSADLYRYQAEVIYWHDGDTARVDVDLGAHVHWHGYARAAGYNSPELYGTAKPLGLEALAYVESLAPAGTVLLLNSIAFERHDEQDSFGRMLAYVTLADGTDLSTAMIATGHAVPYLG